MEIERKVGINLYLNIIKIYTLKLFKNIFTPPLATPTPTPIPTAGRGEGHSNSYPPLLT